MTLNGEPAFQFPYTSEDNVTELVERWRSEYRVTVGRLQGLHGGYDVTGSIDLWDTQDPQHHRLEDSRQHDGHQGQGARPQRSSTGCRPALYGMGLQNEGELSGA